MTVELLNKIKKISHMNNAPVSNKGGSITRGVVPEEFNEFGKNGREVESGEKTPGRRSGYDEDLDFRGRKCFNSRVHETMNAILFELENGIKWHRNEGTVELTDNFDSEAVNFGNSKDEVLAEIKRHDFARQCGFGLTDISIHPMLIKMLSLKGLLPMLEEYYPSSPYSAYAREAKMKLNEALLKKPDLEEVPVKVFNKLGHRDEGLNILAIIMGKIHDNKINEISFAAIQSVEDLLAKDIAWGDWKLAMEICTGLLSHQEKEIGNCVISIGQEAEAYENSSHIITKEAWIAAKKKFQAASLPEGVVLTESVLEQKSEVKTSNNSLALLILLLAILGGVFLNYIK